MLDVSWSEMLLIAIVAILVIGPEDIPKAMMALGRVMRRFQYVKFALSQQFEDIMKQTDLDELRKSNFEKAKDVPDYDEAEADAEYNQSLNDQSSEPEQPPAPINPKDRQMDLGLQRDVDRVEK